MPSTLLATGVPTSFGARVRRRTLPDLLVPRPYRSPNMEHRASKHFAHRLGATRQRAGGSGRSTRALSPSFSDSPMRTFCTPPLSFGSAQIRHTERGRHSDTAAVPRSRRPSVDVSGQSGIATAMMVAGVGLTTLVTCPCPSTSSTRTTIPCAIVRSSPSVVCTSSSPSSTTTRLMPCSACRATTRPPVSTRGSTTSSGSTVDFLSCRVTPFGGADAREDPR